MYHGMRSRLAGRGKGQPAVPKPNAKYLRLQDTGIAASIKGKIPGILTPCNHFSA
jgi:hypothetical protein